MGILWIMLAVSGWVQEGHLRAQFVELEPAMIDFVEWDGFAGTYNWGSTSPTNWRTFGEATHDNAAPPNSNGARAYFGDLDPSLNGSTISLGGNRTVGQLIVNSNGGFTLANNTLIFQDPSGTSNLTLSGSASLTISSQMRTENYLEIINNSTGVLHLTNSVLAIWNNQGDNITFGGIGLTIVDSQIRRRTSGNANTDTLLTKNGIGTLRLNNNANAHTLGTVLNAGTLQVGANGALGSGTFTINGGTVQAFGAARTIANTLALNGDFTVSGAHNLTFGGTQVLSWSGARQMTVNDVILTFDTGRSLQGTGSLVQAGSGGTLRLRSGANTYSGGTTVKGGTLLVQETAGLTIGATEAGRNFIGTGNVTVQAGGALQALMGGDNSMVVQSGAILRNQGGTITLTNTGNTENRDFLLGTGAGNTGRLEQTSGATSVTVGDDIRVRQGSSISVSGGVMNLNPGDAFVTEGVAGDGASVSVSGGGAFHIDITGPRSVDNQITIGQHDTFSVSGSTSAATFTGESGSNINLNGRTDLHNGGTLTVTQGTTHLPGTAVLDGGTGATKGTLVVQGDLITTNPSLVNRPNLTLDSNSTITLSSGAGSTQLVGVGTMRVTGDGVVLVGSSINNIEASVIVLDGGTLILGDDDQIANSVDMTFSGGVWDSGGFSEVVRSMTLTMDSRIHMGNGSSILEFSHGGTRVDGLLTVSGWNGGWMVGGGQDQLIFSQEVSSEFLDNVYWEGWDILGARQLPSGELVPVPEPATIFGGSLLALFVGGHLFRRWKSSKAGARQS